MDILIFMVGFIVGFIVGVFVFHLMFRHWCEFGTYSVYDAESNRYFNMELNKKIIEPNADTPIILVPRKQKED